MSLYYLAIVTAGSHTLLLQYYGGDATPVEQDAWEACVGAALRAAAGRGGLPSTTAAEGGGANDVVTQVSGRPVVLRPLRDLVLLVAGGPGCDELTLVDALDTLIPLLTAGCDGKLTPSVVLDFHGKLVVVLHQALPGGHVTHTDVEGVLLSAKLKSVS